MIQKGDKVNNKELGLIEDKDKKQDFRMVKLSLELHKSLKVDMSMQDKFTTFNEFIGAMYERDKKGLR